MALLQSVVDGGLVAVEEAPEPDVVVAVDVDVADSWVLLPAQPASVRRPAPARSLSAFRRPSNVPRSNSSPRS
jgi:hypothetical protein